ncbi:MAG: helix-turn-helix transcriptional regulator, partial [Rhodobacteraceae bacterium]|nr:helix-turn-helix transcriptional regulator [Paracoccaceae bacterium]
LTSPPPQTAKTSARSTRNDIEPNTDLSLGQVAEILDYSSASAFTHAFKRWKKVAPLEWRQSHGRAAASAAHQLDSR